MYSKSTDFTRTHLIRPPCLSLVLVLSRYLRKKGQAVDTSTSASASDDTDSDDDKLERKYGVR